MPHRNHRASAIATRHQYVNAPRYAIRAYCLWCCCALPGQRNWKLPLCQVLLSPELENLFWTGHSHSFSLRPSSCIDCGIHDARGSLRVKRSIGKRTSAMSSHRRELCFAVVGYFSGNPARNTHALIFFSGNTCQDSYGQSCYDNLTAKHLL